MGTASCLQMKVSWSEQSLWSSRETLKSAVRWNECVYSACTKELPCSYTAIYSTPYTIRSIYPERVGSLEGVGLPERVVSLGLSGVRYSYAIKVRD